jgi:hypothetical protein
MPLFRAFGWPERKKRPKNSRFQRFSSLQPCCSALIIKVTKEELKHFHNVLFRTRHVDSMTGPATD